MGGPRRGAGESGASRSGPPTRINCKSPRRPPTSSAASRRASSTPSARTTSAPSSPPSPTSPRTSPTRRSGSPPPQRHLKPAPAPAAASRRGAPLRSSRRRSRSASRRRTRPPRRTSGARPPPAQPTPTLPAPQLPADRPCSPRSRGSAMRCRRAQRPRRPCLTPRAARASEQRLQFFPPQSSPFPSQREEDQDSQPGGAAPRPQGRVRRLDRCMRPWLLPEIIDVTDWEAGRSSAGARGERPPPPSAHAPTACSRHGPGPGALRDLAAPDSPPREPPQESTAGTGTWQSPP